MSWNEQWQIESGNDYWKTPDKDVVELMNEEKKNDNKSMLDLGCGIGRHSILFAQNDFDVTAIDISENAIRYLFEWAQKTKIQVKASVNTVEALLKENRKFQFVLSYNVIYHGTISDVIRILEQVHQVMEPGGTFFFTIPSRQDGKYGVGKKVEPHTFLCEKSVHKGDIHYFTDDDDLKLLLKKYKILSIKKDEHIWIHNGEEQFSSYYKTVCSK